MLGTIVPKNIIYKGPYYYNMLNARQQDQLTKEQIILNMIESLEYLLKVIRGEVEITYET